ncbi:MAG: DUF58 domain-containing protein, partial [Opitutales bacterium]
TLPGVFLVGLAVGIGTAAYNTGSNILFVTLSLLLACLLLSGLMSWFNFMGVRWRLRPSGPWRAGRETFLTVEVANGKRWLPTYGLWFDFLLTPRPPAAPANAPEPRVREVLAAYEKSQVRGRLHLRERLEAKGAAALDWVVRPERRGAAVVELAGVGSFFPFGFLRKSIGTGLRQRVRVWPAAVEYRWRGAAVAAGGAAGRRSARAGTGEDLLALRKYAQGDSHRLIHWKASARLGTLMVRQFANESLDGYSLRLDTPAAVWTRPEQFELLCGFAGSLAEDLFAAGRLQSVALNGVPFQTTRHVRDIEAFLDELALLQPADTMVDRVPIPAGFFPRGEDTPTADGLNAEGGGGQTPLPAAAATRSPTRNLITFAPEGARGVTAHVDGIPTASA